MKGLQLHKLWSMLKDSKSNANEETITKGKWNSNNKQIIHAVHPQLQIKKILGYKQYDNQQEI